MVIPRFTKLILNARTITDFKDHAQGLKEVERSINGCQSNLLLLLEKVTVELLGTQRSSGVGELLIDQNSWMASLEFPILEYAF